MSKDLTAALDALSRAARTPPAERPQPRGAAKRVVSSGQPAAPQSGSGSVASPFIESDASTREYWANGWRTTDGIFTLPAIKTVFTTDANDNAVVFQYANPSP